MRLWLEEKTKRQKGKKAKRQKGKKAKKKKKKKDGSYGISGLSQLLVTWVRT